MADPAYFTGTAVNRAYRAKLNGKPYSLASGIISVWQPDDVKAVNGASMAIAGDLATYQIATSVQDQAGTYTVQATLVYANSQGTLLFEETYAVTAAKS